MKTKRIFYKIAGVGLWLLGVPKLLMSLIRMNPAIIVLSLIFTGMGCVLFFNKQINEKIAAKPEGKVKKFYKIINIIAVVIAFILLALIIFATVFDIVTFIDILLTVK